MSVMMGADRGGSEEEWGSDSGARLHISHTRAGMTAYKKASPGTTVEVADGNILPVNWFATLEVGLDQPDNTTELARTGDVAYVPRHSRNLLSAFEVVEQ